jgi:M6 family metalloprotease-like protein/uncharacterized repeat protein (TIGR02543 family)
MLYVDTALIVKELCDMKTRRVRSRCLCNFALFLTVVLCLSTSAFAAPFQDMPQTMTQPDGTKVNYFVTGDEYFSYSHDSQGKVLMEDPDTGYLVYAAVENDTLVPSSSIYGQRSRLRSVGVAGITPEQIPAGYIEQAVEISQEILQPVQAPAPRASGRPLSIGQMNNVVMFISFADGEEFTESVEQYQRKFDELRTYYQNVSYGQFDVVSHLLGQTTGAVIPYVDPNPAGYYDIQSASNPDGFVGTAATYTRRNELLKNAFMYYQDYLETSGIDYDVNRDGSIDCVTFVHAGSQSRSNHILGNYRYFLQTKPCGIELQSPHGTSINEINYTMTDKNRDVRVHEHEIFHILGGPDLYQYNPSPDWLPAAGFDLMGRQGYGHMTAQLKEQFGQWLTIPTIRESGTYTLDPIATNETGAIRILSPYATPSEESFVVEYRKRDLRGDMFSKVFDYKYPEDGLIVYRVKDTEESYSRWHLGNSQKTKLEDMYLYAFRPYVSESIRPTGYISRTTLSAGSGRREMGEDTEPAIVLSDGRFSGITISDVGFAGDTITFHVEIDDAPPPEVIETPSPSPPPPPDTWIVAWTANGGSPVPNQSVVKDGTAIDEPPLMEREGYDFGGWYLDSGFSRKAVFPLTITDNATLYARWFLQGDRTTYLVPDTGDGSAYIDLSTEELTLPDGFSIAAYSVDGGMKWKKGPPKLPALLNKPLQLALTDNYDSKAKRPADTAQILRFPGIQARPKANPERLAINYAICADLTGATPGAWTLAPRNSNQAKTDGLEIALSSNKKTPDIQPDGSTWFAIGEDGIPVLPYGAVKPTYLARSTPIVQDATIVPASKIFKLKPLIQQKPTKIKADYKKEILKVKADGMIFGGDLAALKAAAENPQRATGAAGFDEGLVYQATKADRAGVSLTAILDRTGPDAVQTVCLWMPATAKKPATQVQEYRLARRAELLPQAIGGVNGRVRLPKTLEVLKSAGKWSSTLPKVTQTATYEDWVRVKAVARGTGFDDASQFAASRPAALTIEYGVYTPPDARKAKSGVLEVRVGDWQEEEAEQEAA